MYFKTTRPTLNFIIFFIISLLLFSCKKSEEVVFPFDLTVISIKEKTAVRVFTKLGEITDAKIKARYTNYEVVHDYHMLPIDSNFKISFLSKDSVLMGSSKFSVERNDKLFLFHSEKYAIHQDPGFGMQVQDILKYSSPKIPVVGGYALKETRVSRGNYDEMQLSGLRYLLQKKSGTWRSTESGILFNEFDEGSLSLLGVQDTLSVRELIIDLKSK